MVVSFVSRGQQFGFVWMHLTVVNYCTEKVGRGTHARWGSVNCGAVYDFLAQTTPTSHDAGGL